MEQEKIGPNIVKLISSDNVEKEVDIDLLKNLNY